MEAERHLIGLCLTSQNNFERAMQMGLSIEHFADQSCAKAFQAMRKAESDGGRVNLATVAFYATPETMGDLAAIIAEAPLTQSVEYYASEVVNQAWKRTAHRSMVELASLIATHKPHESLAVIRENAQLALERLLGGPVASEGGPRIVGEVIPSWIADVEERVAGKKSTGIETGFHGLNILFNGGWHRGAMYTVAARPGRGKTTFGVSTAVAAAHSGARVVFATVEMPAADIVTKLVSNQSRVKGGKYQSGTISDDELERTIHGVDRLVRLPLWIDDHWEGDIRRLILDCGRIKRRSGLDLVVLDYIGLARMPGDFDSRREQVAEISKACKMMAHDLDCALIVLAQLNRQAEQYEIPGLEHIADADNIGRDSDGVVLIYRDKDEQSMFSVAKNRWGREVGFPVDADLACNAFRSANLNWEAIVG